MLKKAQKVKEIQKYLTKLNDNKINRLYTKSIANWRDSLHSSNSNDVLVVFTLAHNEEVKSEEK